MAKRRGNNEGSIYKRPDGRFCAQITVGRTATGKTKRRTIYGKTRREVQEQLTKILADAQQGIPIDPTKQTVGQFLTRWLEDSVQGSRRQKTYRSYEQNIRLHVIPTIGAIPLTKLTPQHLQHIYGEMQAKGLTHTVRICHAVLHCSLDLAMKWGLIPRNPADLVDPPRVERKEMKVLTPDQVDQFLDAAKSDRFYALYAMAVTGGQRIGELLGLKWSDIDFNARTARIVRQLQWIKGEGLQLVDLKTKHSRRSVFLSGLALDALKEHRKRQLEERLKLGEVWQDNDLVFCTEIGTPISASNIHRRSFHPILKKAGLPSIRLHDLRHTAATTLLASGVHPKVVAEQLGHSQISITIDLYSHVLPSMKKQVAEVMDKLFPPRESKKTE